MPRHRRERRGPLRVVLTTVKGAALGGLLTAVVVGGMHSGAPAAGSGAGTGTYHRVVQRAVAEHECSYTGFGSDAVPGSALIRTAHGRIRQVSFEVGWDVYNGRRPGTLVAVCLDETDGGQLVKVQQPLSS